jgi:quinol monooxygenase YgiN
MAVKVIVELQAKPGMRDELRRVMERIVAEHGSSESGFHGSERFAVVDQPDVLVEIANWESAEARVAHMQQAARRGIYAPIGDLLAGPFRVTVLSPLT